MSKIFVSYKFTGEDPNELKYILDNIRNSLERAGHIVTCSFHNEEYFQTNKFSSEEIYEHMLKKQEQSDTFLAFLKSEDPSKGMKMEFEKALLLGQRIILASKVGLHLPELYDSVKEKVEYETYPELFEKLEKLK